MKASVILADPSRMESMRILFDVAKSLPPTPPDLVHLLVGHPWHAPRTDMPFVKTGMQMSVVRFVQG